MEKPSTSHTGQKEASYHAPPVEATLPTGDKFSIHSLRCLDSQIHLGFHLLPHIFNTIVTKLQSSTYVLITDENLYKTYADVIQQEWQAATQSLGSASPRLLMYKLPPGERTKSRQVKEQLEDWMLSQHCVRDSVILAFGGGVIGDLSGFVAATFMRGIKYVQIPTTLLAMVDSAVGGKTAIDTPHGKNLVGAFHQPEYVFVDAALLQTLPEREFSNGMAEVIKTAAIWDAADFAKLESSSEAIRSAALSRPAVDSTQGRHLSDRSLPQTLLLDVIRGSIGVKAHIVTIDEKETGLRNLVNFGHSIGHAIEAVLTPDILHGECVSIGMVLEAELSRRLSRLAQVNVGRLTQVLKAYNLPVALTDPRILNSERSHNLTVQHVLDVMRMDKKNAGNTKKIVLLREIGLCHEEKATSVSDEYIRRVLAPQVKVFPGSALSATSGPIRLSTPGSKSISNRALILASLAKGTTKLRNLLHSDDTGVMMTGLSQLKAAQFDWEQGGEVIVVHGNGGNLVTPPEGVEIYLQNAGTAARFMTSVAALATDPGQKNRPTILTGNARMKERPIEPLVEALRSNGVAISHQEKPGFLPLAVAGESGFTGGHIQLAASISSQYVSSILLAAPLARQEDVVLELVGGKVISQPYIDMTIAMMRDFGAKVERAVDPASGQPTDTYRIARGGYVSPGVYDVESDASSATYPLAFAAISGSSVVVEKIGSKSLQGDARFAREVLGPMGCTISQTASETSVTGPQGGQLHQIESGEIDMEPMTDAFLTAAVLLAVAAPHPKSGAKSTRIRGIANQRVKECNRIQAMIDELAKFGVKTVEHEDGLEVFGVPRSSLTAENVSVHCYDDHRVAMAFSILATAAPSSEQGVTLEEKRCVEKTWPNWWDDLEGKLGVSVAGVNTEMIPQKAYTVSRDPAAATPLTTLDNGLCPAPYAPHATLFLIGMRGSGKTYLGRMAAVALGRTVIDADQVFEERHGSLKKFVAEKGWPAFREAERELLADLMDNHAVGHVVSLGGGVVETEPNRNLLKQYARTKGPVVHTIRDLDEITAFLSTSNRPAWGESLEDVWGRRKPWFHECSSVEVVNYNSQSKVVRSAASAGEHASVNGTSSSGQLATPDTIAKSSYQSQEEYVSRVFRFISGQNTNHVDLTAVDTDGNVRTSYLLTLTFPDILPALPLLDELSAGADALELRVDLLSPTGRAPEVPTVPPKEFVALQVTALRQKSSLPIVFTVRTKSQGGFFPDDAQEEYFDLVKQALRMGLEYIDLETGWPVEKLAAVKAQKGHTRILASHHDWTGSMKWDCPATWARYELASRYGDVVKFVGKALSPADNIDLEVFREKVAAIPNSKPLLAINMSAAGQMSRILNPILSLITHDSMPFPGAPGQLSFANVMRARHLLGYLPKKKFCLFGKPIGFSLSPRLHNTAHTALGLPHFYERMETDVITDELVAYIRSPNFGGASVTMPLKMDIIPHLDDLTPDGKIIGAINTIIPVRGADGKVRLIGDNTDWLAILSLSARQIPMVERSEADFCVLIIGAGGSARAALYSMHKLGAKKIFLYNRTHENAVKLQKTLPASWSVEVVDHLSGSYGEYTPRVIISNVPAEGTSLDAASGAGVILPPQLLRGGRGGVAIDMSYKPHHTPLLELVKLENESRGAETWTAVPGLKILLEQGFHQYRKWTSREPPRALVERECWKEYSGAK